MRSGSATLYVFATTEQGTLAALQHAAALARSTDAQVAILVPHILGYGVALDPSTLEAEKLAASYRDLASRVGLDVSIRVCPCREARHAVGRLMLSHATVVLGGRRRAWPATAEQQLARELACDGHDVAFVDVATGVVREERLEAARAQTAVSA